MSLRLLLVEDDPVSRSFLYEALSGMPAQVDAAADIAGALRHAAAGRHDLWLVDAHLPDGDGVACLRALRMIAAAPALAITASATREELDHLCASGFLEVLLKPLSVALLRGTVSRLLGGSVTLVAQSEGKLPVWDEAKALAAIGGNRKALLSLRAMFLDELPRLRLQVLAAQQSGNAAEVHALMHRLKASCGFVGASRLLRAVELLDAAPMDVAALQGFEFAATDALESN